MKAGDIIKNKVYESMIGGWSLSETILIFFAACLIGLYIFAVYKLVSKAAFYSRDLNITIAGLVIIVACRLHRE